MQAISSEQFQQLLTIVYVLIALLGGVAFVGIGGVIALARGNKETLRMAFQSASPETQQLLRGWAKEINDVADLASEITAGQKSAEANPGEKQLSADKAQSEPAG